MGVVGVAIPDLDQLVSSAFQQIRTPGLWKKKVPNCWQAWRRSHASDEMNDSGAHVN